MAIKISAQLDNRLKQALRGNGRRLTSQRKAVCKHLYHLANHPTAEQVFMSVRSELPHISLATVYKTLETLTDCGLSLKVCGSYSAARYDHNTTEHGHMVCIKCNRVWDLPTEQSQQYMNHAGILPGFTVLKVALEVIGICPDCAAKSS